MGDCWMNPGCCPIIPPPPPVPPAVLINDTGLHRQLINMMEENPEWQCYRDVCNVSLPSVKLLPTTTAASASVALPLGITLAVIFLVMCIAALLWYRHKKRSGRTFALGFKEYQDKNFYHNKAVKNQCWKKESIPTTDDTQKTAAMFQTKNDYVELGTEKRDPQYLVKTDKVQAIDVESPGNFEDLNAEGDIPGAYGSYDNASFTKENDDKLGHSPGANSHTPLFDEPDSATPASLPPLAHNLAPKLEAETFLNSGPYNSIDKLPPVDIDKLPPVDLENSEKVSKPKIRSSKKRHGHRKSKRISDPGAGATTQHETVVRLKSV